MVHYWKNDYFYYQLEEATDGFNDKNFIGTFQFGRVYRGFIEGYKVVVKIWEADGIYKILPGDNESRLKEEIDLHEHFTYNKGHQNLATLMGYCYRDGHLGAVYDLDALNTLQNMIAEDSLTWLQRIKVALGFASTLEFLHCQGSYCLPYLIRNIDAAHIMLDKDYNPILYDFSMISGGILTDKRHLPDQYVNGCHGYVDPICAHKGKWTRKCDVFSYGVLLLSLISKRVYARNVDPGKPFIYEWAKTEYEAQQLRAGVAKLEPSLVHHSLMGAPFFYSNDGTEITKVAMQCVDFDPQKRPTMKQIVKYLNNLRIFNGNDTDQQPDNLSGNGGSLHENSQIKIFSYETLSECTKGFSKDNFIGNFQFGKVFRGMIQGRHMTVKIWEVSERYDVNPRDNASRLRDEIVLLQHPQMISHPNIVKLAGYCHESERLGVVYDLKPFDSVHNLIQKDYFTWQQRIKVAFEFARLLESLHSCKKPYLPYIVRNLDAAHIILDEEYNPHLIDFGMFTGGTLSDRRFRKFQRLEGCYGYIDRDYSRSNKWSESCDVFAYGIILMSLISKRINTVDRKFTLELEIDFWAVPEYEAQLEATGSHSKCSLVHWSLEKQPGFYFRDAARVTKLGVQCLNNCSSKRPTMKKVVKRLQTLCVLREQADDMGIKQMVVDNGAQI